MVALLKLNATLYNSKVFTIFTIVKISILPTSKQSGRGNGVVSLSRCFFRGSTVVHMKINLSPLRSSPLIGASYFL